MKTAFHIATASGLSQTFGRILMLMEAAVNNLRPVNDLRLCNYVQVASFSARFYCCPYSSILRVYGLIRTCC